MAPKSHTVSSIGFKIHENREERLLSVDNWLKAKSKCDGAEGLWRIHNELYDLSSFIDKHPGGREYLELTKGTDVTEAFESHHLTEKASIILQKYHVRNTKAPRSSPLTFSEDGFFRTIKQRVIADLQNIPVYEIQRQTEITLDSLLIGTMLTAALAAARNSFLLASIAAVLGTFTAIIAHNFSHKRDNFRMYYMELILISNRDWRVSHALSHHLFPNSVIDLEISEFEPLFHWLPNKNKKSWVRFAPFLYFPLVYAFAFPLLYVVRIFQICSGNLSKFRIPDLIPLIMPITMFIIGGSPFTTTIKLWVYILVFSSFVFFLIGVNVAHHHPKIFHDGDKAREDLDWGLYQMDTVWDRGDTLSSRFLTLITFGEHTLHHLFPTLDHNVLPLLRPTLEKTCQEFGINYEPTSSFELFTGQFRQLLKIFPNLQPPGKSKC